MSEPLASRSERDRMTPGGKRLALGLVVGTLIAASIAVSVVRARQAAEREWRHGNAGRCRSHLHTIGQAIDLYAGGHGGMMPPDLATLCVAEELTADTLVCRSSDDEPSAATRPAAFLADVAAGGHQTYVYVRRVDRYDALLDDEVVAFEPIGHHPRADDAPGMNVLRGDGKVEWVTGAAARSIVERHARGERPIRLTGATR